MTQQQYNEAIHLIGQLIFSDKQALRALLYSYGISFKTAPSRSELIEATILMLEEDTSDFATALTALTAPYQSEASSSDEDDFFGGLLKGAIGAIGGLLKKKKNRNRSNGNSSVANQSQQAQQFRRDLERKVDSLIQQQRDLVANHRDQLREKQKEMEAFKRRSRSNMTILIAVGGLTIVTLIGVVLFKTRPTASTA